MDLVHFIHRYPPAFGGAESYCARLTQFLQTRGHNVTVWSSNAIELSEMWRPRPYGIFETETNIRRFRPLGFRGRRVVLKALSMIPWAPWQALTMPCNPVCPSMWNAVAEFTGPLDAVHVFAFPYGFPMMCGLRLARRRGVPFFITPFLHLGDPTNPHDRTKRQYTSRPLRWLLRQADGVFVQTKAEFDAVLELGIPKQKITLQSLGVDANECTGGDRGQMRQKWGASADTVVLGHLANNSEEKGTVDFLQTIPKLPSHVQVVLAGPEMPNFQQFWQNYPHRSRVIRMGRISDPDKRDFYAGIDAFVLPSRTDSFGLVLLEAWANGKPNVVYRAGGPGELVRDEVDGLQVACGNQKELADKLIRLVHDCELRSRLGLAGADRVRSEFRWRDKLECVERVIQSWGGASKPRTDSGLLTV